MFSNGRCSVCGGTLTPIGNGAYKCKFCKNVFQETVSVQAPTVHASQKSNGGVSVFDKNINGILEIGAFFEDGFGEGSGLLIDDTGFAITNAHVVTEGDFLSDDIRVRMCGKVVGATVVALGLADGGGDTADLALLKLDEVPKNATPLAFDDFNAVRNGEQVYVIGNSLGDGTCITSGIVSDKSRVLNGRRLLMTDCAINAGNSGGPIFNSNGNVIGVIVSSRIQSDGSATEGMNYAIPSDIVEEFICGKHRAYRIKSKWRNYEPIRHASCPQCNTLTEIKDSEKCVCPSCNYVWQHANMVLRESKKSLSPCPRCGSWNTDVENNISYCYDCDYEWGG